MSKPNTSNPNHAQSETHTQLSPKTYEGRREGHTTRVTVNGKTLNPRLDLWNHSPTEFEWGYGGSGPAQLALALLADHLGDEAEGLRWHQDFKFALVARLPKRGWRLTSEQIRHALESLKGGSAVSAEDCGL